MLAGGCFWGVQAVFQHTKGVTNAVSGYAGGDKKDADYETVSSARTGHAEAVQVTFDPRVISYGKILQIYLLGRAQPDRAQPPGAGHRPAIPLRDFPAERRAGQGRQGLHRAARRREGVPAADRDQDRTMKAAFYPAEAYHQDYATLHPSNPYIVYQRRAEGRRT